MCRFIVLLLALAASSVAGQEVPTGPLRPSGSAQCVQAFAAAFKRHFQADECRPCRDIEGFPGARWAARYTACHRDCGAVTQARFDALSEARNACFARARHYANEQEQEKQRRLEGMKAAEKMASAFQRTIEAYDALNDPERFLRRILNKLPNEARRRIAEAHEADPMTVAAQVHAFTNTLARQGIDAASRLRGRSDVIAAIQRESFDRIEQVHRSALNDLNIAMHEANQTLSITYGAQASSFRPTPIRSLGPDPRAGSVHQDADCGVLSTSEAADLANDDPDRFEELTARCRGARGGNR